MCIHLQCLPGGIAFRGDKVLFRGDKVLFRGGKVLFRGDSVLMALCFSMVVTVGEFPGISFWYERGFKIVAVNSIE